MSLINDALKKAQQDKQREREGAPATAGPMSVPQGMPEPRDNRAVMKIVIGVGIFAALFGSVVALLVIVFVQLTRPPQPAPAPPAPVEATVTPADTAPATPTSRPTVAETRPALETLPPLPTPRTAAPPPAATATAEAAPPTASPEPPAVAAPQAPAPDSPPPAGRNTPEPAAVAPAPTPAATAATAPRTSTSPTPDREEPVNDFAPNQAPATASPASPPATAPPAPEPVEVAETAGAEPIHPDAPAVDRPGDRIQGFIDSLDIQAHMVRGASSRILTGGRVYRIGALVSEPLKLRLHEVRQQAILFQDESGVVYEKKLGF